MKWMCTFANEITSSLILHNLLCISFFFRCCCCYFLLLCLLQQTRTRFPNIFLCICSCRHHHYSKQQKNGKKENEKEKLNDRRWGKTCSHVHSLYSTGSYLRDVLLLCITIMLSLHLKLLVSRTIFFKNRMKNCWRIYLTICIFIWGEASRKQEATSEDMTEGI